MSQTTLNSYFSVKKRPVNQHAAKSRKLEKSQDVHSSVITTFKDDHVVPSPPTKELSFSQKVEAISKDTGKDSKATISELSKTPVCEKLQSTPSAKNASSKLKAVNSRTRKRDAFGQRKDDEKAPVNTITRFTIGKSDVAKTSNAKRKLVMNEPKESMIVKEKSASPEKKLVSFQKAGSLSPVKVPAAFSVERNLEKVKPSSTETSLVSNKREAQHQTEKVLSQLEKCTPDQVKAKIGQVKKLSELKARIQELNKDKNFINTGENKHRRQLFSPPKLSKDVVTLEVDAVKYKPISSPKSSPVKSGLKASPRKVPQYVKHDELLSPDGYMPLPRKYKFLAEVFRSIDDVVGMKFNRKEVIRVADLKPAVQNIIRKTFDNNYLRQIRCVLPKAYIYTWEKILDRLGRHSSGDYELQMTPDMNYNTSDESKIINASGKLGPREKVERLKLFNHSLLQIAKDYHQDYLKDLGWTNTELGKEITKWHPKFDVDEHCPEIDTVDFPPKPHVERMSNAKDMIEKFAGINHRLESVLQDRKEQPVVEKEKEITDTKNPEPPAKTEEPKILKGLKGLPPALLQQILAKEKEKSVKDVTQNTEQRKRIEQMEELIAVSSCFLNCHRSIKNGAAVEMDVLTKRVADSYGHGKTKEEMLKLLKMFLNLVPECMELRSYDRVTYVKKKKDSPDINAIKTKLQKLVDQEKNS